MAEATTLRLAEDSVETPENTRRIRRLEVLRDEQRRVNRRAAGPFSHPYAIRGTLSKLSEQIRDVSRVADAVMMNAESASPDRVGEICADVRSLLRTQQRWTDRLENQIWRLESQTSLMKRLHRLLQDRSPANERMWELCEIIARETQALPTGLLLLPEPGHRVLLNPDAVTSRATWSLEQARLAVFTAGTLFPDVRGVDIVARTIHESSRDWLEFAERDLDTSVFAEPTWRQRRAIENSDALTVRLIQAAGRVLGVVDSLSIAAENLIVPPAIENFYQELATGLRSTSDSSEDFQMSCNICRSLRLPGIDAIEATAVAADDSSIVLTHKLRWHDGAENVGSPQKQQSRIRRPHFPATNAANTTLTVFARED